MRKLSHAFMWISLCAFAGDRVDPEVQDAGNKIASKLLEDAKKAILPAGTQASVSAKDGRVIEWSIDIPEGTDFRKLPKGVSLDEARNAFRAWAEAIHPKLLKLTTEALKAAGSDPEFNPQTDFILYVFGRIPNVPDVDNFCWLGFTGSRRDEQFDLNTRKVLLPASAGPSGGKITVSIKPDRAQWGLHETITGSITIANTGTTRIHLSALWINSVRVTDPTGKEAESTPTRGCALPWPGVPQLTFISAGKEYSGKFEVITDGAQGMVKRYLLPQGKWKLAYGQGESENVSVTCEPADIEVK